MTLAGFVHAALILGLFGCTSRLEGQGKFAAKREVAPVPVVDRAKSSPVVSVADIIAQEPIDWDNSPVMRSLRRMTDRMTETHYVRGLDVHLGKGYFAFDCSGMVDWVLRQSSPIASGTLRRGLASRPLAADFVRHLSAIEPGKTRGGWLRIGKLSEARSGDVIAWIKPKIVHSANTGHVAIIVRPPRPRADGDSAFLVRVADSSRLMHENDTRRGRDGYGIGTILVESDPLTQGPTGFHFAGSAARHALGTKVVIGRAIQ